MNSCTIMFVLFSGRARHVGTILHLSNDGSLIVPLENRTSAKLFLQSLNNIKTNMKSDTFSIFELLSL